MKRWKTESNRPSACIPSELRRCFWQAFSFWSSSARKATGTRLAHRTAICKIAPFSPGFPQPCGALTQDAVSVSEDQLFGQVLNLSDGDSGYALRLYMADGALLEEYSRADAAPSPEAAQKLGDTWKFAVSLDQDLLQISTDAGTVLLHLRSEAGS